VSVVLYLIVHPWFGVGKEKKYAAIITDKPGLFPDAIFKGQISDFSDQSLDEAARKVARGLGIMYVQGLGDTAVV
jgi:hypothetical protein